MILSSKLKHFAKKYIPKTIQPFFHKLYVFVNYRIYIFFYKRSLEKYFTNFEAINRLLKLKTVKIIQLTYYSSCGTKYLSGGAERYVTDLCKIIKKMGLEPYIIQQGKTNWHLIHEGINIFGVKADGLEMLNVQSHNKVFGVPELTIYSPFALAYPKTAPNSIGISHGIFWDQIHSAHSIKNVKKSFDNIGCLVSVDTVTINWFRSTTHFAAAKKNMIYIPNYVDLDMYKPSINKKNSANLIILFPRRLYKARGYFLVTDIIESILDKYSNVEFHFVGQYDDPNVIKSKNRIIKKYGGRVKYYQENANKMHLIYQKSDITLIPTVASEGTSLSCIEAMASGNAVIATNVGGLTDLIINKHNGLLIEPTSNALHDAIIELIEKQNLRTQLAKNAMEVAKTFCYKEWKNKWIEIINESIEKI